MELPTHTTEISVKLLSTGKYTWTITTSESSENAMGSIGFLKSLDAQLRDTFPDHVTRGSGKVSTWED